MKKVDYLNMDKDRLYELATSEDKEAIDGALIVSLELSGESEIVEQAVVGAVGAALNIDKTIEMYSNARIPADTYPSSTRRITGEDAKHLITGEAFSNRTPDQIAEASQKLNTRVVKRNEFAETCFPTIVQPTGTVAFYASVTIPYIKVGFNRNTGTITVPKEVPFNRVVNDTNGPLTRNDSQVIPVVGVKAAYDAFLELNFKEDAIEPQTGDDIETAPIKIATKVPYLDLCQSATAASESLMTDKTYLDPNGRLDKFGVEVGTERYWFDVPGEVKFGETFSGDSFDIELSSNFRFSTVLTGKEMITGVAGTEFNGAANVVFVYDIFTTGMGNVTEKEISVYVNSCTLVDMLVGGKSVPSTDANYATYKAVGDKFTTSTIKAVTLETYISNEDMYRIGKRLTLRTKTVPYGILPTTPYTVINAAKGFQGGDDAIVNGIATAMLPEANLDVPITLLAFATSLKRHGVNGLLPDDVNTGTIGQYLVRPYYSYLALDLSTDMNSMTSDGKKKDIPAAIELNAKALITDMLGKTGLAQARTATGKSVDIIVACGTNVGTYLPKNFDLGVGVNVKIVSTSAYNFVGKVLILPGNFSSNRNSVPDFLSIGGYLFNPVLVGETIADKAREYSAHLFARNAVFCPTVIEIDITGLDKDGALGNTVQQTHAV